MSEIKRAIKLIESHIKANKQSLANGFEYTPEDEILQQNEEYCLILECLQSELERAENKPLTLRELEDMVGEPVWVKGMGCFIVDKILEGQRNIRYLSACIYESDIPCIEAVKLGCYKHKPTEISKWISVEDRLPDDGVYVIVAVKYEGRKTVVEIAAVVNGLWRLIGVSAFHRNVTHWQPLPEIPQNERK